MMVAMAVAALASAVALVTKFVAPISRESAFAHAALINAMLFNLLRVILALSGPLGRLAVQAEMFVGLYHCLNRNGGGLGGAAQPWPLSHSPPWQVGGMSDYPIIAPPSSSHLPPSAFGSSHHPATTTHPLALALSLFSCI